MVLVAALELNLRILPQWQSEAGLLYRVGAIGLNEDNENWDRIFAEFESDLAAVRPKIESLAKRRTASRSAEPLVPLDIARER